VVVVGPSSLPLSWRLGHRNNDRIVVKRFCLSLSSLFQCLQKKLSSTTATAALQSYISSSSRYWSGEKEDSEGF
jgi:hypothetical protein